MSDTALLSSDFRISIPEAVRTGQGWEAGQEFAFVPSGKGMLLMPVPSLDVLRGIAKGADTPGVRDRKARFDRLLALGGAGLAAAGEPSAEELFRRSQDFRGNA